MDAETRKPADREQGARYAQLRQDALALMAGEPDWLANLANLTALVYERLPGLNWAGVYLLRGGELVLGPFQGRPACVRIAVGRGVCGTAVSEGRTQVVADVHAFPGHIACDPRSRSEIVIPLRDRAGRIVGVLDLDSDRPANFDEDDREGLEALAAELAEKIDWEAALGA